MATGNGNWVVFLRMLLGFALTAIIGLQGVLYTQLSSKIDSAVHLFKEDRDRILATLDKMCEKLSQHDVEIMRLRSKHE